MKPMSTDNLNDLTQRVVRLEASTSDMLKGHYSLHSEFMAMKIDLSYLKTSQDKVLSGINRILWAIGLTVLGSITAFILQGGLKVGLGGGL